MIIIFQGIILKYCDKWLYVVISMHFDIFYTAFEKFYMTRKCNKIIIFCTNFVHCDLDRTQKYVPLGVLNAARTYTYTTPLC